MISGILFDAAGVLYLRQGPTAQFALRLLQDNGFSQNVSERDQEHLEALRLQANQGIAGYNTYWDRFLFLRGVSDCEQRKQMMTSIIDFSNNVQPVPGGRETLAGLKQRGYALGIVTDTMYPLEWKKRRLEKAGVAEFIDVIACSTALGLHKPDPAIYQYAIQQLNLTPPDIAFVGHLGVELNGAHLAGMTTIAVYSDPDAKADYFCKSLPDLLTLPIFQRTVVHRI